MRRGLALILRSPRPGDLGRAVGRTAERGHSSQVALLGVTRRLEARAVEGAGELFLNQVAHLLVGGELHPEQRGRLDQRYPCLGITEPAQLPVPEEPIGVGLRPHQTHMQTPRATTLNASSTPRARSTRSRMRCRRLLSRSNLAAIWAKVDLKSGWEPTSCTSVVAHPASEASRSSSMSSTVFPTPRRP
jgi:hypothetical protein